ncbi:hypothetical protein EV702DRAFT_1098350 [Suillus placidus]|uniref:Uncharacterized protein n=1 Tax=Suillus placidus TaxID=48579 RepID=A0A9P6ZW79_9AGAM|nr:hypothetical protein EV702DRAFT_1098350 [Suillus placidus]
MSNLSESPPSLTEKLTVRKVLRAIGAGIFLLSHIINGICMAVIFTYLAATIPALEPYAIYFAAYTLGARTVSLTCVFLVGCYWCCLRLIAPKQAGSISEWSSKVNAHFCEALNPSNGKLGRAGRTYSVCDLQLCHHGRTWHLRWLVFWLPLMERTRVQGVPACDSCFFPYLCRLVNPNCLRRKGVNKEGHQRREYDSGR